MSKIRWTEIEKKRLRIQIKKGKSIGQVHIEGRTFYAIRYQTYKMSFCFVVWKRKELFLLKQMIKKGNTPKNITIPGRSPSAIRQKAIKCGIWKPKLHLQKLWTMKEIKFLNYLVCVGYTAKKAVSNGHFPGRSQNSISQQIQRQKFNKK